MNLFRRFLMGASSNTRSCFGSGIWIGRKPWLGSDKWKSHK